jgi:hypothetical protein
MGTGRANADLKHVENANHATRSLIINNAAKDALRIVIILVVKKSSFRMK